MALRVTEIPTPIGGGMENANNSNLFGCYKQHSVNTEQGLKPKLA